MDQKNLSKASREATKYSLRFLRKYGGQNIIQIIEDKGSVFAQFIDRNGESMAPGDALSLLTCTFAAIWHESDAPKDVRVSAAAVAAEVLGVLTPEVHEAFAAQVDDPEKKKHLIG